MRVIPADPAERRVRGPSEHGVHLVGFLRAREQQIAQAAHRFLRHHRPDRPHMLHVDLREPVRGGLHDRPVLVRDDRRRAHDVLEHGGPPCELQFGGQRLVRHAAVVQVVDEPVKADHVELPLEAVALGQGVERAAVVEQRLEPFLDVVELHGLQVAAGRGGGQHRVERGYALRQRVLRLDDVVKPAGQHRPTAVRHEYAPLVGLLGHNLERLVQALDLRTDAQQALGLLDVAAALPESHRRAFGLARGLRLGGLDHRGDVALEDLRLEHVEHAAQVLEHRDLAAPFAGGCRHGESAGLHGGGHLVAGGRQQLAQQVDDMLVGVHRLLLAVQRGLEPHGVFGADGEFAELAGTAQLARPLVEMAVQGTRSLEAQAHPGGRMGRHRGDTGQVLDRLVGRHAPLLARSVKIAEIPRQARAHADQLVGKLVEP